jgi:hypothetical protein
MTAQPANPVQVPTDQVICFLAMRWLDETIQNALEGRPLDLVERRDLRQKHLDGLVAQLAAERSPLLKACDRAFVSQTYAFNSWRAHMKFQSQTVAVHRIGTIPEPAHPPVPTPLVFKDSHRYNGMSVAI